MMPGHQNGILNEDFHKKFEIKAFKSSHALNALGKYIDNACLICKVFVYI